MRATLDSPLGRILLTEKDGKLVSLDFVEKEREEKDENLLLQKAKKQLDEFFSGKRKNFDLPLAPEGTAFQKKCWNILLQIPYGTAISYGREAALLGSPRACRAVGGANGKNPLPILIPCHRVISESGKLGGYSAGLDKKIYLLELEKIPYKR